MTLNLYREFCLSLLNAIFFVKEQKCDMPHPSFQSEVFYNQATRLRNLTKIYEQIKSVYDNNPFNAIIDMEMTRLHNDFLSATTHLYNFEPEDSDFKRKMFEEVGMKFDYSKKNEMEQAILEKYFPHFTQNK